MGERKKQAIERLQGEVELYRSRETALGPYVTIAQELHERVMSRVQSMDENDLERALVEEIAETEEDLVRRGIQARIDKLPIRTVLEWYAKAFGGEEVAELLKQRAEIAKEFLRDNMHVERMRQRGASYGNVDISEAMPDDVMGIVFAHTLRYPEIIYSEAYFRKLNQEKSVGRLFELVGVKDVARMGSFKRADIHSVMALGGALIPKSVGAEGNSLDPVLSRGTPLQCWSFNSYNGEPESMPREAYGYIEAVIVNGVTVLGGELEPNPSGL